MKSPLQYRRSPDGEHLAVTLRVCVGPKPGDTRLLSMIAKGSPDDPALRADLRRQLAEAVAECVRADEWPDA